MKELGRKEIEWHDKKNMTKTLFFSLSNSLSIFYPNKKNLSNQMRSDDALWRKKVSKPPAAKTDLSDWMVGGRRERQRETTWLCSAFLDGANFAPTGSYRRQRYEKVKSFHNYASSISDDTSQRRSVNRPDFLAFVYASCVVSERPKHLGRHKKKPKLPSVIAISTIPG